MAVVNTVDDVFTHPKAAAEFGGARNMSLTAVIAIAAADDDGSIYFIGELPDTAVIDEITLEAPAITAATDYRVGLYNTDGSVISDNVFSGTLDMSSTSGLPTGPTGDPIRQAMVNLALTDANKKLYELAAHVNKAFPAPGETNRKGKYRLGLKGATVGSAAATVVARVRYREYI